jgi:hypothetical protein
LDKAGIVVMGHYSDGTDKIEDANSYSVTGYDPEKPGYQTVVVNLNGRTATMLLNVGDKPEERDISVTIGFPNDDNKEPEIFGIPDGGIILSTSQNGHPDQIVISAAGKNLNYNEPMKGGIYSSVYWYIDGVQYPYNSANPNIITIYAADYTLKIPHYLTFVGTIDEIEYSRTITFTVER